jgi:hypothetical protein
VVAIISPRSPRNTISAIDADRIGEIREVQVGMALGPLIVTIRRRRSPAGAGPGSGQAPSPLIMFRTLALGPAAYTLPLRLHVPSMISIAYLLAYDGGAVEPGDDMRASAYRWWSLDAVERERPELLVPHQQPWLLVPHQQPWLLDRAIELYRLWRDRPLPEMSGAERH